MGLAVLAFGAACTHTSTQSSAGTAPSGAPAMQQPQASGTGDVTQDPIMQPGPRVQGHAGDELVAGRITEVTNDTVSVRTAQGDTKTLQIVPETEIQLDGQDASAADLGEGQPVRASFDLVDGQQVAVKVHAGAPGAGQGGTASGAPPATEPMQPPPDQGTGQGTGSSATDSSSPPDQGSWGTGSSGSPDTGSPSGGAPSGGDAGGASGGPSEGGQRW
jgi:hypothetical protein